MTRIRRSFTLAALTLCAACALLQTGSAARADLNITAFPYTISGNVKGNVTITNPNHLAQPVVTLPANVSISGSVEVRDNCTLTSQGQISGTIHTFDSSITNMVSGSAGKLYTEGSSHVNIGTNQAPITVGGIDSFGSSWVLSGNTTGPNMYLATTKYAYAHGQSVIRLISANVPAGVWAEDQSHVFTYQTVINSVVSAGECQVFLDQTYCSAGILQFDASSVYVNGGTNIMSSIIAYGWSGDIPPGAKPGRVAIEGGTTHGRLSGEGGRIEIYGGSILNGPLYGDPTAQQGMPSVSVIGHGLYLSGTGRVVGSLSGGGFINVPYSGTISLYNF